MKSLPSDLSSNSFDDFFSFRSNGPNRLSAFHMQQIDYQRNVIPPAMRSPTPMELFLYRSQTAGLHKIPGMGNFFIELFV